MPYYMKPGLYVRQVEVAILDEQRRVLESYSVTLPKTMTYDQYQRLPKAKLDKLLERKK